jgi:DNA-binding Lrp family transcriptional regulator
LILYRDTKRDGTVCTSQADIARRADLSEKSVQRAVKTLEHRRLLRVIWRGGINQGPSRYRVGGDLM